MARRCEPSQHRRACFDCNCIAAAAHTLSSEASLDKARAVTSWKLVDVTLERGRINSGCCAALAADHDGMLGRLASNKLGPRQGDGRHSANERGGDGTDSWRQSFRMSKGAVANASGEGIVDPHFHLDTTCPTMTDT